MEERGVGEGQHCSSRIYEFAVPIGARVFRGFRTVGLGICEEGGLLLRVEREQPSRFESVAPFPACRERADDKVYQGNQINVSDRAE